MDNWIGRVFWIVISVFYAILCVAGVVFLVDYVREVRQKNKKEV